MRTFNDHKTFLVQAADSTYGIINTSLVGKTSAINSNHPAVKLFTGRRWYWNENRFRIVHLAAYENCDIHTLI